MDEIKSSERQRLIAARDALLQLHKVLLDGQRAQYESEHGKLNSANEFLQLAISDPAFEWLHRFSELVVEIDEATDGKEPLTVQMGRALLEQARALIGRNTPARGVGSLLDDAVRTNVNASKIHAELARILE